MRKYLEPIILGSALAACSGAKPKIEPLVIQLVEPSENTPAPETVKTVKQNPPEPIVTITDQMRWRLHNMNKCSTKNWNECNSEVNALFFELAKKIPKDVDRKCREDGDYAEGCVEKAYEQHVGKDALLEDYLEKDKKCKEAYNQCTTEAEANCDSKCWHKIKKAIEKEKQAQEKQSKDWTAPKNP